MQFMDVLIIRYFMVRLMDLLLAEPAVISVLVLMFNFKEQDNS